MKKIVMSLIVALMFVLSAGPAMAGNDFGKRMNTHQHRIEAGTIDRSLTANEVKRLFIYWDSINERYLHFMDNDQRLDAREAEVVKSMQDHMGVFIYKLRHNSVRN